MGVQMRTKTEETAEPLIENNNKDGVEEPLKPQPPQKREILWATAIYLTTWHVLAVICTILYWKNVKVATILWSKCNIIKFDFFFQFYHNLAYSKTCTYYKAQSKKKNVQFVNLTLFFYY